MTTTTLTPEKIEQLKEIRKQLDELRKRSEQRIIELESIVTNQKLYCA